MHVWACVGLLLGGLIFWVSESWAQSCPSAAVHSNCDEVLGTRAWAATGALASGCGTNTTCYVDSMCAWVQGSSPTNNIPNRNFYVGPRDPNNSVLWTYERMANLCTGDLPGSVPCMGGADCSVVGVHRGGGLEIDIDVCCQCPSATSLVSNAGIGNCLADYEHVVIYGLDRSVSNSWSGNALDVSLRGHQISGFSPRTHIAPVSYSVLDRGTTRICTSEVQSVSTAQLPSRRVAIDENSSYTCGFDYMAVSVGAAGFPWYLRNSVRSPEF